MCKGAMKAQATALRCQAMKLAQPDLESMIHEKTLGVSVSAAVQEKRV